MNNLTINIENIGESIGILSIENGIGSCEMRDSEYKLLTSVCDVLVINESCYRPSGKLLIFAEKKREIMNVLL